MREAALRVSEFNLQDFVNTSWVLMTFGQQDEKLFAALARGKALCVSEFSAQDITNTAWAFATLGQLDEKLFALFVN